MVSVPGRPADPDASAAVWETRWRALVDESPTGVAEFAASGACTYANAAFGRIVGGAGSVLDAVHGDDAGPLAQAIERAAGLGVPAVQEVRIGHGDGSQRWIRARLHPQRDHAGVAMGCIGTFDDVTERRRLEERLAFDATHDRLTGLGGRALLVEQCSAALARARRSGGSVGVLFVNLDGFKHVNDRLGHAAGDELLLQVARRLREAVRESDVCVRLGGDEFVVGCTDMDAPGEAVAAAERVMTELGKPFDVHGHEILVSAGIGVATVQGEDPVSVDQLLANADVASFRAKREGGGRIELFDENLRRVIARRRRVDRSVTRLLDTATLPVVCTPVVGLLTGEITGFHLTIDWQRAGLPAGDDTVEIALADGVTARALDAAMLRTAVALLAAGPLPGTGVGAPVVGFDLLAASGLGPTTDMLEGFVRRHDAEPARLRVGIPDAAMTHDPAGVAHAVGVIGALGATASWSNFGARVPTLDRLEAIAVPLVVLPHALVIAMHDEPDGAVHASLLQAIALHARAAGRRVAADGVQDAVHAARLAAAGVDEGFGPAFGPDQPFGDDPA